MAGAAAAGTVVAAMDTDAAATAMDGAATDTDAEPMLAEHADMSAERPADTLVERAVERRRHVAALVAAAHAADSAAAAMQVAVAATAAADTGKIERYYQKGPSASAGGLFVVGGKSIRLH